MKRSAQPARRERERGQKCNFLFFGNNPHFSTPTTPTKLAKLLSGVALFFVQSGRLLRTHRASKAVTDATHGTCGGSVAPLVATAEPLLLAPLTLRRGLAGAELTTTTHDTTSTIITTTCVIQTSNRHSDTIKKTIRRTASPVLLVRPRCGRFF